MYEVNYNSRSRYVNNYILLSYSTGRTVYDVERDLLAIAKFLVRFRKWALGALYCSHVCVRR